MAVDQTPELLDGLLVLRVLEELDVPERVLELGLEDKLEVVMRDMLDDREELEDKAVDDEVRAVEDRLLELEGIEEVEPKDNVSR